MAELQRIEFSEEETQALNRASGFEPEVTTQEEVVTEGQETIGNEQEIITTEEQTPVEEQPVVAEEPQLIIQEPEPSPVVETQQPEAVSAKMKVQIHKDAFQAALNKYYQSTENPDVAAFARAYHGNYDNLEPIEIIRQEIMNDPFNKGLRVSVINKLLQEKLSRYDLDSDDPEERADNLDLIKREAEMAKSRMMKSDKEFVSQFESDLEIEIDAPQAQAILEPTEEEIRAQREALEAQYLPEVAKFVRNGVIQIQDMDGVVNIPAVDQAEYINSLVDPVSFIRSIAMNPDGTPNYGKWIQFVTAAKNLSGYNSTMIKHGIAIGQDKFAAKIKNEAPLVQPRGVEPGGEDKTPQSHPQEFMAALENIRPYKR